MASQELAAAVSAALSSSGAGLAPMQDDDGQLSISLTPLYGTNELEPLCSLLRVDNFQILLDLGWDIRFREEDLEILKRVVPDIDAVLITHADLAHMGALPYAVAKLGLKAKVYMTVPVRRMGEMVLYDAVQAASRYGFSLFSLDDVDSALEHAIQLKYSQEVKLSGGDRGDTTINITPYCAGHSLGGCFWRLVRETEDIVYAVDVNHRKEAHLMGTVLEQFPRPSVLITDSLNGLQGQQQDRKTRDRNFFSAILETMRGGGNVLLPVETAGRVLELLYMLNRVWEKEKLGQVHNLVFLSHEASHTLAFARSLIEWMNQTIQAQFDQNTKVNPLALAEVRICESLADFRQLPEAPFVCFATDSTLETGLAREIFLRYLAPSPHGLVLMTSRTPSWSLASALLRCRAPGGNGSLSFLHRRNVRLTGAELDEFLQRQEQQRREKAALDKLQGDSAMSDSDDDEGGDMGEGGRGTSGSRLVPMYPMFPFEEQRLTWTVYGEPINRAEISSVVQAMMVDDEGPVDGSSSSGSGSGSGASAAALGPGARNPTELEALPHKVVEQEVSIQVRCRVIYEDLEGRCDGQSLKNILSKIRPRKLILLRGSPEAKMHLREYCEHKKICSQVSVPAANQLVDITSAGNVIRVHLQDALLRDLEWKAVGDFEVAYADGGLLVDYKQSTLPILARSQQSGHQIPASRALQLPGAAPESSLAAAANHPAVFVGDLKFNDLKRVLNQQGIAADFFGGVLVCCGGLVNIRKVSATKISIQGGISPEYYQIRNLLYGQFSIV